MAVAGHSWEERRVAKPEWGTKRTCLNCDAHFYDLQRNPIRCPRCNSSFIAPEASFRAQRQNATKKVAKSVSTKTIKDKDYEMNSHIKKQTIVTIPPINGEIKSEGDEEALRDADDEETGNPLMEDASDLGADDDDMAEVMERLGS